MDRLRLQRRVNALLPQHQHDYTSIHGDVTSRSIDGDLSDPHSSLHAANEAVTKRLAEDMQLLAVAERRSQALRLRRALRVPGRYAFLWKAGGSDACASVVSVNVTDRYTESIPEIVSLIGTRYIEAKIPRLYPENATSTNTTGSSSLTSSKKRNSSPANSESLEQSLDQAALLSSNQQVATSSSTSTPSPDVSPVASIRTVSQAEDTCILVHIVDPPIEGVPFGATTIPSAVLLRPKRKDRLHRRASGSALGGDASLSFSDPLDTNPSGDTTRKRISVLERRLHVPEGFTLMPGGASNPRYFITPSNINESMMLPPGASLDTKGAISQHYGPSYGQNKQSATPSPTSSSSLPRRSIPPGLLRQPWHPGPRGDLKEVRHLLNHTVFISSTGSSEALFDVPQGRISKYPHPLLKPTITTNSTPNISSSSLSPSSSTSSSLRPETNLADDHSSIEHSLLPLITSRDPSSLLQPSSSSTAMMTLSSSSRTSSTARSFANPTAKELALTTIQTRLKALQSLQSEITAVRNSTTQTLTDLVPSPSTETNSNLPPCLTLPSSSSPLPSTLPFSLSLASPTKSLSSSMTIFDITSHITTLMALQGCVVLPPNFASMWDSLHSDLSLGLPTLMNNPSHLTSITNKLTTFLNGLHMIDCSNSTMHKSIARRLVSGPLSRAKFLVNISKSFLTTSSNPMGQNIAAPTSTSSTHSSSSSSSSSASTSSSSSSASLLSSRPLMSIASLVRSIQRLAQVSYQPLVVASLSSFLHALDGTRPDAFAPYHITTTSSLQEWIEQDLVAWDLPSTGSSSSREMESLWMTSLGPRLALLKDVTATVMDSLDSADRASASAIAALAQSGRSAEAHALGQAAIGTQIADTWKKRHDDVLASVNEVRSSLRVSKAITPLSLSMWARVSTTIARQLPASLSKGASAVRQALQDGNIEQTNTALDALESAISFSSASVSDYSEELAAWARLRPKVSSSLMDILCYGCVMCRILSPSITRC